MSAAMRGFGGKRGPDRDLVYLLLLARKYGLEPDDLYHALAKARRSKESTCDSVSIELRQREDKSYCFMFSREQQPVAQASISESSMVGLRHVPPEFKRLLHREGPTPARTSGQAERRIADLHVGLKHVCLKAKVTDKSEVRAVDSRNGEPLVVSVATLSDGTGQIRLPLWNKRIDSVSKNDTVVVRDATVRNFRGEMQLSLPWKTGSISTVQSTTGIGR